MSLVYAIEEGEYSDYHIVAIFSTEERAIAFIGGKANTEAGIREFTLDDPGEPRYRRYWSARIEFGSGAITRYPNDGGFQQAEDTKRGTYGTSGDAGWAESYVSQEHADKLVFEGRQAWLRAGKPITGQELQKLMKESDVLIVEGKL